MADAAAQDLAQHVAAAFVRRQHAVVDEEGGGAGVVGDDAEAGVAVEGVGCSGSKLLDRYGFGSTTSCPIKFLRQRSKSAE